MKKIKKMRVGFSKRALDEEGMSLIEVVIAFSILTFVILATTPLLLSGIKITADQSSLTAATGRVQSVIEEARKSPVTCTKLNALTTAKTYNDGKGSYTVKATLPSGCTASATLAQSIPMTVTATKVAGGKKIIELKTNIYVGAGL